MTALIPQAVRESSPCTYVYFRSRYLIPYGKKTAVQPAFYSRASSVDFRFPRSLSQLACLKVATTMTY